MINTPLKSKGYTINRITLITIVLIVIGCVSTSSVLSVVLPNSIHDYNSATTIAKTLIFNTDSTTSKNSSSKTSTHDDYNGKKVIMKSYQH